MNAKTWHFYTGLFLTLGTTAVWIVADAFLVYMWIRRRPHITNRVILWILLLLSPIFASMLFAAWLDFPLYASLTLPLRAFIIIATLSTLIRYKMHTTMSFWIGAMLIIGLQATITIAQFYIPGGWHSGIPEALSIHSSALGLSAAAVILSPVGMLASIPLGFSLSRTFIAATFLIGLYFRRKDVLVIAAVAVVILFIYSTDRILPSGIENTLETRAELNHPNGITWYWHGAGYGNYNEVYKLEMPHNIWILSWYELGIFSIPFWTAVAFTIWHFRYFHLLPFALAGFFTPEFFSEAVGLYGLALYHISVRWHQRQKEVANAHPI